MASSKRVIYISTGLLVIALLAALLVGPACTSKERTLRILASSEGSKVLMAYTYLAKMITEEKGILSTALPGAEQPNYELLESGQADVSFGNIAIATDVYKGTAGFAGKPHPNLRTLMTMNTGFPMAVVVRGDSKYNSVADLLGKRVAYGEPGSSAELAGIVNFEIGYGITKKAMEAAGGTIINLSKGEQKTQLADRTIDAMSASLSTEGVDDTLIPTEAMGPGVRILSPSQEAVDKVKKAYPAITTGYLKGGMYKNHPNQIFMLMTGFVVMTRAGVPDDVIYDFLEVATKPEYSAKVREMTGWEGWGQKGFIEKHISAVPLHPGAAKWFREHGYDISAIEVGK